MIAAALADRLGLSTAGRAIPLLRETRAPCVVIAVHEPTTSLGHQVGQGLADFYESGAQEPKSWR